MISYNKEFVASQLLNANFNSPAMEVHYHYTFCVVAIITGTPTGTIHLEASNDPFQAQPPGYTPGNFNTIDNSTFTVTTAGITTWNYVGSAFNYVRVSYVDTSGGSSTAHLEVRMNAKG